MSALSILFLVLPFPLLFIIHDTEEVMVQHRWMSAHKASLMERLPPISNPNRFSCLGIKNILIHSYMVVGLLKYSLLDGSL